jgi:NADH-quinone oxidoreductase subunit I
MNPTTPGNITTKALPVHRDHFRPNTNGEWSLTGYLTHLGKGSLSLARGLGLTMGYLLRPSRIITQEYPENRETLTMFPRFRGRLAMVEDEESGETLCTACSMCEKACPNGTISVLSRRDETGRKILGRYIYRLNQCTLCGLCVESCPFGALCMAQDFELASYDRRSLELVLFGEEE